MLNSFNAVSESQVYIYQGEVDEMLSFNQLSAALQEKPSYVNLVPVANATHSNAFKLAGEHYLNTIVSLLRPDS